MRYFLDTEFNGFGGALISLGLVRGDGLGAYYVLEPTGGGEDWAASHGLDPWVKDNVIPHLWDCPKFVGPRILWGRKRAAYDIAMFLDGDPDPVVIADWPADLRYLCGLIEFPEGQMAPISRLAMRMVRRDSWPNDLGLTQHNAYNDALALRYVMTGLKP